MEWNGTLWSWRGIRMGPSRGRAHRVARGPARPAGGAALCAVACQANAMRERERAQSRTVETQLETRKSVAGWLAVGPEVAGQSRARGRPEREAAAAAAR